MSEQKGLQPVKNVNDMLDAYFGEEETAIHVIDLHKRYRKFNRSQSILNGLNLKCSIGKFYVLYGTAKSGKSALVKSILNIESFSRGSIAIFNKDILDYDIRVGYMPQRMGLDYQLTAVETINYFAILQNIDKLECIKNFSTLQSPMTISSRSTLVNNLSEDQKRVLSFYIAIMASPKLIVLDQPMAGCDPLYKNFFWQKLRSMVDNEGTTVFMTCCDEIDVKHVDIVGYLRYGQIVAEEPPDSLMKRYNIWSFNDLIYSISVAELREFEFVEAQDPAKAKDNVSINSGGFTVTHFTNDEPEYVTKENIMNIESSGDMPFLTNCLPTINLAEELKIIRALVDWQLVISFRNYLKAIYHLLLPVLCLIFYAYSVGNEISDVNVGIVHCAVNRTECLKMERPICLFENQISDKYLQKIYYENYKDANQDVKTGKLNAILLFDDKETNRSIRYNKKFGCESTALEHANIVLEIDVSLQLLRSHIIDQVSRAYGPNQSLDNPIISRTFVSNDDCLSNCPITPLISNFRTVPRSSAFQSQVDILIWGAVATIAHFSGALLGALPLCVQNRDGILDRMKMMGITHCQLQLVHWTTRTFFMIGQNLLMVSTIFLLLSRQFTAHHFFIGWFVILLQTLCGFSFGILLFGIFKKRVQILFYLVLLELIVSMISGFLWHFLAVTSILRKLAVVIPHSAVAKLLQKVIIQNISTDEDNIWTGFVSPIFWMISTYIIYRVLIELNK